MSTAPQLDEAKSALETTAERYVAKSATSEDLGRAAWNWAEARRKALGALGGAKASPTPGAVFPPYGRSKGLPVAGASAGDLQFYRSGCERTLADPEKARFHEKERALLAAIDAELEGR